MDMGLSCRKNAFFQASKKSTHPVSGPRIADKHFTDTRIFLMILANRFRVPKPNPFFSCESRFGGLKIANCRFEAIRTNPSHIMKIEVFLRIDSRESILPRIALQIARPSQVILLVLCSAATCCPVLFFALGRPTLP